ncbi:MAG: hypothetical protein UT34_C0001G0361 [candidate division WS6 bacterium GW2011_GWF2_39_15]|uniref:Uncharacterized protein n=1 Tax=candidate division WS6 bacterium GW2011_GWF2_39_15 TaxID=1619100 RepID=A0A0G0N0G2_9BACT|nr:MAG: hypothetical protein UT34_C0001G0361 [candidate division WS6 bacterium GW2011_GWF2_39_15]
MIKLPNLEKSANLLVELSQTRIVAKLVYNDYTIARHYVRSDTLRINSSEITADFLVEYLNALEKYFDWEFFRNNSSEMMTFADEGFGLDSIIFILDTRAYPRKEYVEIIREVSKDISILQIDNGYVQDLLMGISEKLGYEDVVLVDLNLDNTYLYRLHREKRRRTLNESNVHPYVFKHGKIELGNEWKVIDNINSPRLKAFLEIETNKTRLQNSWANYVLGDKGKSSVGSIKDLLRAYMALQLLTIRNDNKGSFDKIGENKYSTLVLVTGSITTSLQYSTMLLSLIDAMELTDVCDIAVDNTFSTYNLGKVYAGGVSKTGFLTHVEDFISRLDQIVIPDVANEGEKKRVLFTAKITNEKGDEKNVYALSNEITQIIVDRDVDIQEIKGEFIKGSSLYSEFKYGLIVGKRKYNSVIVDSRYRPIIYGPEPKDNHIKMSSWMNAPIV